MTQKQKNDLAAHIDAAITSIEVFQLDAPDSKSLDLTRKSLVTAYSHLKSVPVTQEGGKDGK